MFDFNIPKGASALAAKTPAVKCSVFDGNDFCRWAVDVDSVVESINPSDIRVFNRPGCAISLKKLDRSINWPS